MPVIQGTVFEKNNPQSKRIPDTRITFTLEDRSQTFRATADQKGRYRVELPTGRYRVTATADGYAEYSSAPGFAVVQRNSHTVNIFLRPLNQQKAAFADLPLVVDAELNAFRIKDVLKDRFRLKHLVADDQSTGERKPELPLIQGGELAPGVLYDSPNDTRQKYYLPDYTLRIVDTQYTTRLNFRNTDDDPHGPIAYLTIEFVAADPVDRRFKLSEIEHTAVVRLGYKMAVSDDESSEQHTQPQPDAEEDGKRPTLWINLGALEKVSQTVRRCQLPIHSKEEYDRLFQIMSSPGHNARLEIQCRAAMGYRTWRQIFARNVKQFIRKKPVSLVHINPSALRLAAPAANLRRDRAEATARRGPVPSRLHTKPLFLDPDGATSLTPIKKPAAIAAPALKPAIKQMNDQLTPAVKKDLVRVATEIEIDTPRINLEKQLAPAASQHIKLPTWALVDKTGEPVITRREVVGVQTIAPFWFNTDTHAYMFDIPETPTTRHILLRHDMLIDGSSVTFYQDSIMREQMYYEPQAFRLSRTSAEPYAPDLLFAFSDVSEEGEEDAVSIDYRVRLAYRVLPDIDQRFLNQARLHFDQGAIFTALTPSDAALVLRLPDTSEETWIPVNRTEATISFDDGIVDEVELTSSQFQKVFSAFQSPATIGLEGTVQATLQDGSATDIPVQVSLQDNTGPLFDSQVAATASPGQYQVTLTNRIESPVQIHQVAPLVLAGDAIAHPAGLSLPATVAPNASVTLIYNVSPPDTPVAHLAPVLDTTIAVDYERLWSLITVNQGFVSRTFDVRVSIQPTFFSTTPAGAEPLTSVVVDFDSLVTVELTPEEPAITVPLRMPLLPVLLNQLDAAQSYQYRVTNQHGTRPGATSAWIAGSGDLQIVPPRGE